MPEKPNIVFLLGDDCTRNDLGCYGGQGITPHIDRMAKEGLLFEQAVSSAAMCTPTRHCLYTGLHPIRNGGHKNHSAVKPGTKSICHYLGDLGYRVGLAGKTHIQPPEVFPFEMVEGFPRNCVLEKTPRHRMDGVREFMTRDGEQPFCIMIASVHPHRPYTEGDPSRYDPDSLRLPPHWADTARTREMYQKYFAELTELDGQVGDVLDLLREEGLERDTIFIFASEQGAQFPGAKWTLWDAGVRFGMIVRWPGRIEPNDRTDALVQYEDVLPTLIELAGGRPPAEMDGRSFLDVLARKTDEHREYAYGVHSNDPEGSPYPIRSIRTRRHKLIHNLSWQQAYYEKHQTIKHPASIWWSWLKKAEHDEHAAWAVVRHLHRPEFQFYDLEKDPYELNNLADDPKYAGEIEKMRSDLEAWMKSQGDEGID